jgi:catechol 2,3-dioxygenase-like lactoylglutathione lyase family enzyme
MATTTDKNRNPLRGWIACRVRRTTGILLCAIFCLTHSLAQTERERPHILGIAHIAFDVGDAGKTRTFYRDVLGFEQAFSLERTDGTDWIRFIKINDQQYVELFSSGARLAGELDHLALYTDDVAGMKAYVVARGIPLVDQLHKGRTGDEYFSIRDPDGHLIEIVQYQPDSWSAREKGNFVRPDRLSDRISHAGIVVGSMAASLKFYHEVLGFGTFAQDMHSGAVPQWANLRVPNGTDYLVLHSRSPATASVRRNVEMYIGFASTNVERAASDLKSRAPVDSRSQVIAVETGMDKVRRTSVPDPDGIRIDFTESPASGGH